MNRPIIQLRRSAPKRFSTQDAGPNHAADARRAALTIWSPHELNARMLLRIIGSGGKSPTVFRVMHITSAGVDIAPLLARMPWGTLPAIGDCIEVGCTVRITNGANTPKLFATVHRWTHKEPSGCRS
ncbi:hypothetical protein [Caballeronia sordidicola]|uniref:hypothetical protein n=1 Tax=Caballeronia sordidicola TaxID=196367 RepID=UPI00094D601A|nr:hypothetical protein [Caballeronia sordidicola]